MLDPSQPTASTGSGAPPTGNPPGNPGAATCSRGKGRRRKKTPPAPLTPQQVIKQRRRRCADAESISSFLVKLVAIILLLVILLAYFFGITPMENDDMSPRISAGDLLLYYRLADDYVTGDVMVFEKNGQQYVGRIVAQGGDTVQVTDQATLVINGSTVLESDIYYTTPKYDNGPTYPLTLAADEYFILCDYREGARDSRYFGPVSQSEVKGKVITVVRRSDI